MNKINEEVMTDTFEFLPIMDAVDACIYIHKYELDIWLTAKIQSIKFKSDLKHQLSLLNDYGVVAYDTSKYGVFVKCDGSLSEDIAIHKALFENNEF